MLPTFGFGFHDSIVLRTRLATMALRIREGLRIKAIAMHSNLLILVAALLLTACSSSGGPVGGSVGGSEIYEGRQTAAVAPVADRRPGRTPYDQRLHADIQRDIQRQLDRSGIFAGVVALEQPDEGNEAEVIIEPTLVGPSGGYAELNVRVTEKTNRKTVLDRTYGGAGGGSGRLDIAVQELEDDLARRYGK